MSIADRMSGMSSGAPKSGGISSHMGAEHSKAPEPEHESGGDQMSLHSHGDGSYHTEGGPGHTEHPHIGHALMHMAHHMGPGGKHHHAHAHEGGMTSHHVGEDGNVEGPHDHENVEDLKSSMGQFLDEEGNEGHEGSGDWGSGHAKSGGGGLFGD